MGNSILTSCMLCRKGTPWVAFWVPLRNSLYTRPQRNQSKIQGGETRSSETRESERIKSFRSIPAGAECLPGVDGYHCAGTTALKRGVWKKRCVTPTTARSCRRRWSTTRRTERQRRRRVPSSTSRDNPRHKPLPMTGYVGQLIHVLKCRLLQLGPLHAALRRHGGPPGLDLLL